MEPAETDEGKIKEELNISFIHSLNKFLLRAYYVLATGGIINSEQNQSCYLLSWNI